MSEIDSSLRAGNVTLIDHTSNPLAVIRLGASVCYFAGTGEELLRKEISTTDTLKLFDKIYKSGHHSCFEHASFTFLIDGITRSASHQLVRHRIASFGHQSLRYTKASDSRVNLHFGEATLNCLCKAETHVQNAFDLYEELIRKGIPQEDARNILPMGVTSNLIVTMNFRELLHFFSVRLCRRAQAEIREIAAHMLILGYQRFSTIFRYGGPACLVNGGCKEEQPCGVRAYTSLRQLFEEYDYGHLIPKIEAK